MKTRASRLESGPTTTRSILDCSGPLPSWIRGALRHEASKNANGIPAQSPGLGGTSYPGKGCRDTQQPPRRCGVLGPTDDTTLWEVRPIVPSAQGSSRPETLGWRTNSLWDWSTAVLLALLFSEIYTHAQSFSIDWFTVDGRGGASPGGVFAVSGTLGQPDANAQPLTAGGFRSLADSGR